MPKKQKKMWDLGISVAEEEPCALSVKQFSHGFGQLGFCLLLEELLRVLRGQHG